MTDNPPIEWTIRGNDDLNEMWSILIGPGELGVAALWLVFLDERDCTLPIVVPIEGVPAQPSGAEIGNLSMIVSDVIASTEAVSVVLLLARPGTGDVTAQDRRWASMLSTELGTALSRWPIHLASAGKIQVLGPENRPES